ncbi:hypothetical protein CHS0354_000168 [Potamilus streckersoni]|uniref:COR domain-containing protein n=1 Tax=Potamilus streckersoni TaxID=2493646 RepID=A0AAE0S773_9BIVA|nr:hypothetical protein CHS0354_000168 [Potamilus streckersoni]
MDHRSIQLFQEALKDGKETVYSIRIMVVGHMGVGKTTLVKRLLGQEVHISERCSTEGIDVYVNCCDVSLLSHEWTSRTKDSEQDYKLQRLVKVLNENYQTRDRVADLKQGASSKRRKRTNLNPMSHNANENKNTEVLYHGSQEQNFGQNPSFTATKQEESPSTVVATMPLSKLAENVATESHKIDPLREMLKLLQQGPIKVKQDVSRYAYLTILDFAGQYAFYTTHQMFLTRHAIYLLVSDASREVSDIVEDECYFDSKGTMMCKVHDLAEVWLNSIHSCATPDKENLNSASSYTSSFTVIPPPVILVGTHIDQIPQKKLNMVGKVVHLIRRYVFPGGSTPGPGKLTDAQRHNVVSKWQVNKKDTPQMLEIEKLDRSPIVTSSVAYVCVTATIVDAYEAILNTFLWWKERLNGQTFLILSNNSIEGESFISISFIQRMTHYCRGHGQTYLKEIRSYLRDKPSIVHLVDEDFAIDNTVLDSELEELKKKIVEVASQQPYWGEQIPTRWFLLEQQLMRLRDAGVKVISRKTVEDLNKQGTVQIKESEEMDVFLNYLHETGTIIYFSIEVLRENIVLDPKWMIDALKSLINARPDLPSNPADNSTQSVDPTGSNAGKDVTQKWLDFKEKGILTLELVDAVWTKERYPELHAHRDHILMIMEQLNIIAKPRAFSEIGEKVSRY